MKRHVTIFGPGLHRSSHIVNKAIQGDELVGFLEFFAFLIGCEDPCRRHYLHRISTDTDYDEQWTFRAHNAINQRLGKYQPTWEEAQTIKLSDNIDLMSPGVWLFLLYYAKIYNTEECVGIFERFFVYLLDESPESWREYYRTHQIEGDFYTWMQEFHDSVNPRYLWVSLHDVPASSVKYV